MTVNATTPPMPTATREAAPNRPTNNVSMRAIKLLDNMEMVSGHASCTRAALGFSRQDEATNWDDMTIILIF